MTTAVRPVAWPGPTWRSPSWAGLLGRHGEAALLVGCVACALLLRLAFLPRHGVINEDGIFYATLGRAIAAGDLRGGVSAYWSPLYPALVGLCARFVGDVELAGRLVSVLVGSLLVVPAYLLARAWYGRAVAGAATALVVVHPSLVRASGWVMTEALYGLLFLTIVLVGWHAVRGGRARTLCVTGALVGAAYLTRPEAVGYLGLLCALAVGRAALRRPVWAGALVVRPALLVAGFAALAVPYVLAVHQKTGRWTLSQKFVSNVALAVPGRGLLSLTDDGERTLRDQLFSDDYARPARAPRPADGAAAAAPPAMAVVRRAPPADPPVAHAAPAAARPVAGALARRAAQAAAQLRKQLREHVPAVLPYPLVLLALAGFCVGPWTRARAAREGWLLAFAACTLAGYALTVIELRYVFALVPIFAAWSARGAVEGGAWAARAVRRFGAGPSGASGRAPARAALGGLAALVLVAAVAPRLAALSAPRPPRELPLEEKEAGLWLRATARGAPLVMASSATVAFYAGGRHLYVPNDSLPAVLAYARRKGADYLVYSGRRLRNTPRAFPADVRRPPRELRLLYDAERVPGYRVAVYALAR